MNGDEQERLEVELELKIRKQRRLVACLDEKLNNFSMMLQKVQDAIAGRLPVRDIGRGASKERTLRLIDGDDTVPGARVTMELLSLPSMDEVAKTWRARQDAGGLLNEMQNRQARMSGVPLG